MRKQIYKYPLTGSRNALKIATSGRVLSVQIQHGQPVLWVEFDVIPRGEVEERLFRTVATGEEFEGDGMKYVGTFQTAELVWHVYEVVPRWL